MNKPSCYGKYSETFPKQGRACRACSLAIECKELKPVKNKSKNSLNFDKKDKK